MFPIYNTRYIRDSVHSLSEIVPYINQNAEKLEIDGSLVRVNSLRMQTFKKGIQCVSCGISGMFFAKEKSHKSDLTFHLNLYALSCGHEILMTHDHIIPLSKGGADKLRNCQTMCEKCNITKSNLIIENPKNVVLLLTSKKKKK
jgi:5-methylcytosine-specific restriction endonuclease McrA